MAGMAESGRRAQDHGSPWQVSGGCHLEVLDGRAEAGEGDRDQIYGPGRVGGGRRGRHHAVQGSAI